MIFGRDFNVIPKIHPLSKFVEHLKSLQDRSIVYGGVYVSFGGATQTVLIYVRNREEFDRTIEGFERVVEERADPFVVSDALFVTADDADEREDADLMRGLWERQMGFHFVLSADKLVPPEQATRDALTLEEKYGRKDVSPINPDDLAFGEDPLESIEDLLSSLEGKTSDDFDPDDN